MKKIRILLVNIGFTQPLYPQLSPPMGLLYLAGYLRTRFKAHFGIINQRLDNPSDAQLVQSIAAFHPDVIGIGAYTASAKSLGWITKALRHRLPDALIVLGGPHVNAVKAQALKNNQAHAAVAGEGEIAFEKIIGAHLEKASFETIPGIFWRDADGEIIANKGQVPLIRELDTLPLPAYDLIDLPAYWSHQSFTKIPRRKYISLFSSRGCPYQCIYCHRIFGNKFRHHSAERIIEEIKYFTAKYRINDVEFLDDIFNLNRKRLIRFSELMGQNDLKIKLMFPNGVRTDILTLEEIDALVEAGLSTCSFALESGSPKIQKFIGKNLNIPKFLENVKRATDRGVHAHGFAMLGFPTETEKEMRQTLAVACRSHLHTLSCFTVIPFPNTRLYQLAEKTHAAQLAHLSFDDWGYVNGKINLSNVPDEVLFGLQRQASIQFFMHPGRIYRNLKDHPSPYLLPMYIPQFIKRILP